jgi:hypothetical protein
MRWSCHVKGIGWRRSLNRVMVEKPGGNIPTGYAEIPVDWRIILRWIFRKWDVVLWTGSTWLTIGTDGRS